jgi:hypothetical protein
VLLLALLLVGVGAAQGDPPKLDESNAGVARRAPTVAIGDADYVCTPDPSGLSYEWIDATAGTVIPGGDDVISQILWPFDFTVYDSDYTAGVDFIDVNTNGSLHFDQGGPRSLWVNCGEIPSDNDGQWTAPLGDDLVSDNIYYIVTGSPGDQILTIEWVDSTEYGGAGVGDMQVNFYEAMGMIVLQTRIETGFDFTYDGVVGINAGDLVRGEEIYCAAGDGLPSDDFDVACELAGGTEPDIRVEPASLDETLCPDEQTTVGLEICNDGTGPLDWRIAEMTPPGGPAEILIDEGFEGGVIPPTDWTHIQNNPYSWEIAVYDPHSGLYNAHVEYDPALVQQHEWLLSPEFDLAEGQLTFWSMGSLYWCRDDFDNCDLEVWIVVGPDPEDGDDVFVGIADGDWPYTWEWGMSSFDLTPLLPGGPVRIGFEYVGIDGAEIGLDDVVLDGTGGGYDPIPWLSEDPTEGSVDPGYCETVDVTFDSTGLDPDVYFGDLLVSSNDPDEPEVYVPVSLTVDPCAENTIHVSEIRSYFTRTPYDPRPVLRMFVQVMDQELNPMPGVLVDAVMYTPDVGPIYRSKYTREWPPGFARFHWGSYPRMGEGWEICVDNLTLDGYVYDPDQNDVTCIQREFPPSP